MGMLYRGLACALMAPLILQSCNAQSEKKESNKECTEETNKNTEKKVMKTGSENFIFAEGKEWEPAGEGVVRQIMGYNDDIMVVKVKFEKGAVGAVHHLYLFPQPMYPRKFSLSPNSPYLFYLDKHKQQHFLKTNYRH